jgi:hypothetical protein
MQVCYVSIPFGTKVSSEGRIIDFDFIYHTVIKPAVSELEIQCRKLDEFEESSILHKTLFGAIISSDYMIADISANNPNVMYELGIRHALKPGRTIIISAGGPLPWNINYLRTIFYEIDPSGSMSDEAASRFRESLTAVIRTSQRAFINDSPVFEFFPDIRVDLPPELETHVRQKRAAPLKEQKEFTRSVIESPDRAITDLQKSETVVRGATQEDPEAYIRLLRQYRTLSDWGKVIELAETAPPSVMENPEVQQMLALALNRRKEPGDRERAINVMKKLISETGGIGESFCILGTIYKSLYDESKSKNADKWSEYLDRAIYNYHECFNKNPKDYYPGLNVVMLLLQRHNESDLKEIESLAPSVKAVVREKIEAGHPDYWDYSVGLLLSVITKDWESVWQLANLTLSKATSRWMVDATLRDLAVITEFMIDPDELKRLREVLSIFGNIMEREV